MLTMRAWLPDPEFPDRSDITGFYRDTLTRVDRLPGVEAVAAVNVRPCLGWGLGADWDVEGWAPPDPDDPTFLELRIISPSYFSELAIVVDRLRAGARTTILTGAGVSAASGMPTFRGPGGLWKRHRPEALATPEAFAKVPVLVWEWYDWRRQLVAACKPNRAHGVLAAWTRRYRDLRLITQNVDGLHERAGADGVIRFHGSLWEVGCWGGCAAAPTRWPDHTVPFATRPPTCSHCGGPLRPGVVWFGEGIDPAVLAQSDDATSCDLFLTIGTSSLVYPAAGLVPQARHRGAFTVEINPDATVVSDHVDLVLRGTAEAVLDAIEHRVEHR